MLITKSKSKLREFKKLVQFKYEIIFIMFMDQDNLQGDSNRAGIFEIIILIIKNYSCKQIKQTFTLYMIQ